MPLLRLFLLLVILSLGVIAACQTAPVYNLDVTLDPAQRSIVVSGTAKLPAEKESRPKLYFQLAKQMKDLDMRIVEPTALAQKVEGKLVNDNDLGGGNFSADLATPIPAGTPVTIKFSYHGGDTTAFVFHIGPEGSYADGTDIAWYPEFGPRLDQDGKFAIDLRAAVTGKATYNIPSDLSLVASGAETDGPKDAQTRTYTYQLDNPTTFAFSLDRFRILKSPGTIPVALYLKGPRPNEQEMLAGIRHIVDKLTSIYGKFPYPSFALVEVSDDALKGAGFGGAGCAGFMLSSSSFLDQGFNIAFFGHEIGHQWWGNLVVHANEPEGNDLLDEAMAQYGSLYCVRHLVGEEAATRYRWSGYPGYVTSQCGRNFLWLAAAGIDIPLGRMSPNDGGRPHELACEKGFLIFEDLRREIGDDAFNKGLKAVTSKYAYRSVTWAQFKAEIEKAAGRNLSWFWSQWYDRTGAPVLALDWRPGGNGVEGTITQTAPTYRLLVPIRFDFADGGSTMKEVRIDSEATQFAFRFKEPVSQVELDPNFEFLHYTPETLAQAKALVPFTEADWMWFSGKTDDAVAALKAALPAAAPDGSGLEFYLRCRLAYLDYRAKNYAGAIEQATLASQAPDRDPVWMPQCYQIILRSADAQGDQTKARWAARAAFSAERALGQTTSVTAAANKWLADHP